MQYRPELDGIRAIAVIAVLLFHADESFLGGGYVGVDIFFALSGYLITGIISRQMEENRFSFAEFYARRIRRLIPAMLPVVAFSSAMAMALFLSDRLRSFLASLVGIFTYSSNFVFLSEADYFDEASATKPMLHTWSLAVEEQFYLIFPAVLFLLKLNHGTRKAKVVTLALAVASLAVATVAMQRGAIEEAFYVSPFRFWEMLFGSLLALTAFEFTSRRGATIARLVGLALMIVPIVAYTPETSFPGLLALPPVVGTLLVIAGGASHRDIVLRVLSQSLITYMGRISYGLYLWHWPMLVATRLVLPDAPWAPYASLLGSFVVASISYHLLESPLRFGSLLAGTRRPFIFLGVISCVVLSSATAGWLHLNRMPQDMGFYFDWERTKTEWTHDCKKPLGKISSVACADADSSRPTLLLVGDSQAQHLLPGIKSRWPNVNLMVLAGGGCKPIRGYKKDGPRCEELRKELFHGFDAWNQIDLVIVSVRQADRRMVQRVADTAEWIAQKGPPVWFIPGYLEHDPSLSELVTQHPGVSPDELHRLAQDARSKKPFAIAEAASRLTPAGVRFIDFRSIFCSNGECVTFVDEGSNRAPVNANGFHLSTAGSRWFVAQLPPVDFDLR